jgi:signal transduction histidine kinase
VTAVGQSGQPSLGGTDEFVAVLPVHRGAHPVTLVTTGQVAAPFTALDNRILLAIGEQIGAALDTIDLTERLEARSADLERLSARMLHQHEEQRGRLARELHDETAQVFAALKLQLGSLRESVPEDLHPRLERLTGLVGAGVNSIRRVSEDLRPTVLDDLGLLPALQALVTQFTQWSAIPVAFQAPVTLGRLSSDAELAIFRAAQEALSNVARHAGAGRARLEIVRSNGSGHDDHRGRRRGHAGGSEGRNHRAAGTIGAVWHARAPGRARRWLEARGCRCSRSPCRRARRNRG